MSFLINNRRIYMKTKILTVFLLLVVALVSYAGGQQDSKDAEAATLIVPSDAASDDILLQKGLPGIADKPVKVEIITVYSGMGYKVMEEEFTKLVKKYYPNITLEMQPVESGDLVVIVNTRLAAGNPPDLVHCGGSYFLYDWAQAGALYDFSSLWDLYELESIVPKGIANAYKFGDKYYGIPFLSEQSNVMFYNIQVLNEAGVTLPPYESWEEFFSVAEEFKSKSDKSFWAGGYNPAWFAFSKSIALSGARFGIDVYERIINGEATKEDFANMLQFHAKLFSYMNGGYVSMNSITGGSEEVARGEAALCMAGGWGLSRFTDINLELGKDWGMAPLPGNRTIQFVTTGFVVFKDAKNVDAARAISVMGLLKDAQSSVGPAKGGIPSRNDVDPNAFPEIGRVDFSRFSSTELLAGAVSVPRENEGLPKVVVNDYAVPCGSFIASNKSQRDLDTAVNELLKLQEKHQDRFTIDWKL